jgi:hypothetical protein
VKVGAAVRDRQNAVRARSMQLLPALDQALHAQLHVTIAFAAVLGKIPELAERPVHEARKARADFCLGEPLQASGVQLRQLWNELCFGQA